MTPLAANVLVGPTASGKSAVAQYLAQLARPQRPILSADSMTIYRGMDLGTAKPDAAERAAVPSFGFDLVTYRREAATWHLNLGPLCRLSREAGRTRFSVLPALFAPRQPVPANAPAPAPAAGQP